MLMACRKALQNSEHLYEKTYFNLWPLFSQFLLFPYRTDMLPWTAVACSEGSFFFGRHEDTCCSQSSCGVQLMRIPVPVWWWVTTMYELSSDFFPSGKWNLGGWNAGVRCGILAREFTTLRDSISEIRWPLAPCLRSSRYLDSGSNCFLGKLVLDSGAVQLEEAVGKLSLF